MYSKSDFYFLYSEEIKYTNWDDFLSEFNSHKTIFLTNNDSTVPRLLDDEKILSSTSQEEEKIFPLSKTASVLKAIENFDTVKFPN